MKKTQRTIVIALLPFISWQIRVRGHLRANARLQGFKPICLVVAPRLHASEEEINVMIGGGREVDR